MKKIIFIIGICLVLAYTSFSQGYKVGDMVSDFKLMNVDGKMVSLADYKDVKGYVVIFTCNHCPYAKAYEDRIIAINEKYSPLGYPVIAINPNDPQIVPEDSYANMQIRAKEKKFRFPYLFDDGQTVLAKYGATRTPQVYLLNKTTKGNQVAYIGAIDNNSQEPTAVTEKFLENALDALRNGEKPNPDFTKAIGCSIKVAQK
ncbi:MAG: thioredoxin family protein [Omnitrophica WOR_2 bacterium]|jgi:peroxiredoxin